MSKNISGMFPDIKLLPNSIVDKRAEEFRSAGEGNVPLNEFLDRLRNSDPFQICFLG